MASITKSVAGNGGVRFRVFIRPRGAKPITKTFRDEKTAKTWAKIDEFETEHTGDSRLSWWRQHHRAVTLDRLARKSIETS